MRIRTMMVGAAAVALALVPAAQAGGGKAETKITNVDFEAQGQPNPHQYFGTLKSSKAKCEKNRDVRLRVTGGETISESTTNSLGSFTLLEGNPSSFGDRTIYALPKDGCKVAKFQTQGGG